MGFGLGDVFSGIGKILGAGKEVRAGQSALAGLTREQGLGREKAQEVYGEYLPSGGFAAEATQRLRDILIGGDMSLFEGSPGRQFRLEEGTKAIETAAASRGLRHSSGAIKSISDYAQRFASEEFDKYMRQLGGFASLSGDIGLQGAQGIMGQYGNVTPGQIAASTIGVGQGKSAATQALWNVGGQGADIASDAIQQKFFPKPKMGGIA